MTAPARRVGWLRSPPGTGLSRDARPHLGAGPVPPSSDLRHLLEVVDQGLLQSCVGNSTADALRACQVAQGAANPPLPSRLAIYWMARALAGDQATDSGAFIHLAFQALNKYGYPPETEWPYTDQGTKWQQQPPLAAFEGGFAQRAPTDYRRIMSEGQDRIDDVKRALGMGHVVVFGTQVSEAFCSGQTSEDGLVHPPGPTDQIAGGHAMVWCGHEDGFVWGLTSWGPGVFEGGFFRMSWDYVSADITDDLWIVVSTPLYQAAP